jgi:hypothetical protein
VPAAAGARSGSRHHRQPPCGPWSGADGNSRVEPCAYVACRPSDTTKWDSSHLLEPEPGSASTTDTVPVDTTSVTIPPTRGRGPAAELTAAPLPLDARGRLILTAAVRQAADIPDGAVVYARIDPERRTVVLPARARPRGRGGAGRARTHGAG